MSDMMTEMFEWAGDFDEAVNTARKSGKKTFTINAPKYTKDIQLSVVSRAGHTITNPKSKKTWKIKIDTSKNTLPNIIRTTVVSLK